MPSAHSSLPRRRLLGIVPVLAALLVTLPPTPTPAQSPVGGTSSAELVERVVALLESRDGDRFWATVSRLEDLGEDIAPALREQLDVGGEKTRLGVAKALLTIGGLGDRRAAEEALRELARDAKSRAVKLGAIEIYGLLGDPDEALELLGSLLSSTVDPELAIPLARVLWEIDHVTEARDRLLDLLESEDTAVRNEAALTLAEIGYFEGEVRSVLRSLALEPTARGRRAALLDQVMRLSRQLDRSFATGDTVPEGTDMKELVRIKEERIRELEERLEQSGRAPAEGGAPRGPTDQLFEEVVRVIRELYVEPEKALRERLLLDAIRGMVRGLDEHSAFMDLEESTEFTRTLDGNYPGIGAQVAKRPGQPIEILRPIYGGPAYRGGILSGDRVLSVDGVSTPDLPMDDIMRLLKGPSGSTVELEVLRRGWSEPREFSITREGIEVPSVYWERLPASLGYIRLIRFGERSDDEFVAALEKLEDGGLAGLVVDLRDNGGGRLGVAVDIADLFIGEEDLPIVSQRGRNGEADSPPHYPTPGARSGYPVVVLINGNSASASEIVSGALQDFGRATLLGERTYGKGSVQNIIPLASREGSVLKLTVQYYFLPLGRCIHTLRDADGRVVQEGGVEPDIPVRNDLLPTWRIEERAKLRRAEPILAYVDEHFDALRGIVPIGDRGDHSVYEDLESLQGELETRAEIEDIRAVVRDHVRQRLEDGRGREFPFDLEQDRQLQVAILELLRQSGGAAASTKDYGWIEPFTVERATAESDEAVEEADDAPPAEDGDER